MSETTTITGYNFAGVELKPIIRGSKFGPKTFIIKVNGSYINLTSAQIDICFRRENATGKIMKEISETSGITISDPTNGTFYINAFSADWIAGTYYFDVRILLNGETIPLKYIYATFEIKEDSTNE